MNLSEFARARNVEPQTISRYIGRHKNLFEGHIFLDGKAKELDDTAISLLKKKYPLPVPAKVIEDTKSKKKLIEMQEMVIEMQKEMAEIKKELTVEKNKTWWDKLRKK